MILNPNHFKAPSSYAPDRVDAGNTFDLLPFSQVTSRQPGDVVAINLATYLDPFTTANYFSLHRKTVLNPRWQQAVKMTIEAIELFDEVVEPHLSSSGRPSRPDRRSRKDDAAEGFHLAADRAFKGKIALRGEEVSSYGLMHPDTTGWIKLVTDSFEMRTIADLKEGLGKMSADQRDAHNQSHDSEGIFYLPGVSVTLVAGIPIRDVAEPREFS